MSPENPNRRWDDTGQQVSGTDVYHKLGALEGKVDFLIARTTEYNVDLKTAMERIAEVENRMSRILGGVLVISVLVPFIINFLISLSLNKKPLHAFSNGQAIAEIFTVSNR